MVALTLPTEVVKGLRKIDPDLAWAVVTLFEKSPARGAAAKSGQPDAELVQVAERRSLIVVNRSVFKSLPGINIIPLDASHAFLALDSGRGMTDLELAVIDRLEGPSPSVAPRERKALLALRAQLSTWRHDPSLRFHARGIIVVERMSARTRKRRA